MINLCTIIVRVLESPTLFKLSAKLINLVSIWRFNKPKQRQFVNNVKLEN